MYSLKDGTQRLKIKFTDKEHLGFYACVVKNKFGAATCTANVDVLGKSGYIQHSDQGSHSTWKTWKNESTPGKPGNIMEF